MEKARYCTSCLRNWFQSFRYTSRDDVHGRIHGGGRGGTCLPQTSMFNMGVYGGGTAREGHVNMGRIGRASPMPPPPASPGYATDDVSQRTRWISTSKHPELAIGKGNEARVHATVDDKTVDYMEKNNIKPKNHPGAFHLPKIALPEKFRNAVEQIVSHENLAHILENAEALRNHLWSRKLPIENSNYKDKVQKLEERIRLREEALLPFLSQEQTEKLEQKRENQILKQLRRTVYHWEPIHYTREKALEYIFARSAGEYAALLRIFNEIHLRDPKFNPKTLCDFGSGVGTVSWAARHYWSSSLMEHLCADMSWEMNELAESILRGGSKNNDHPIPALFFRNHLPESYKIPYDLVVSAFSLMELPSATARLETVDKLWNKTQEYLVLVESGTKAGFTAIQEARDYILGLGMGKKKRSNCYVFSPCPNNLECPRLSFDDIPCNFEIKYRPIYPFHQDNCANDRISYVVIRRGYPEADTESWPRLLEDPLIRSGHVICRICTKEARLCEVVLTKSKHSLSHRLIARRSRWGDLLPIHITNDTSSGEND